MQFPGTPRESLSSRRPQAFDIPIHVQESDQRRASQHDTELIGSATKDDRGTLFLLRPGPRCKARISLFRIRRQEEDLPNAAFLP